MPSPPPLRANSCNFAGWHSSQNSCVATPRFRTAAGGNSYARQGGFRTRACPCNSLSEATRYRCMSSGTPNTANGINMACIGKHKFLPTPNSRLAPARNTLALPAYDIPVLRPEIHLMRKTPLLRPRIPAPSTGSDSQTKAPSRICFTASAYGTPFRYSIRGTAVALSRIARSTV